MASSLLTELERSAEHLDFRPIDTAIDQVLHALHEAGEVGAQEDESYAKYVQELQKDIDACVRVIDSTKPPPAPKPAPAPVPAPAPAPTTAATGMFTSICPTIYLSVSIFVCTCTDAFIIHVHGYDGISILYCS